MAELRPVEDQRRASAAQQAGDLPARWAAQLRAKASEGAAAGSGGGRNGRGGGGRHRPTSSSTNNSRAPSLLSLESTGQNGPASPTTTAQSGYHSYSAPHQHQQHPPYRHSAAPTPSYHQQQQQHPSSRSHTSLPAYPSSNGGPPHHEHRGGRHRDQLERVYHEQRYDAEFDRGTGSSSTSRGAAGGSAAAGSSSSQQASSSRLFNPDAPAQSNAERRRERELRGEEGGGGSSSTSRHKTRSKREPVEAGDLGRRGGGGREQESKESLESEESGASGRPGSRSSKDGRQRRSRREEQGRSSRRNDEDAERIGGGSSTSLPSQVSSSRQLFDPRRDDPVRFAQSGSAPSNSSSSKKGGDSRSFVSSTLSLGSAASVSDAASIGQEESTTTGGSGGRNDQPKRETENPVVAQLRRAYREITDLETKLQDENKAAMAAAAREDEVGQGLRIQGGGKRYDDEYWVKLAMGHKQLADAHYSFLQMALDPRLPASLHSLPHRYNIPTRLWQTAFHQLLERMRHAIVSAPPPSTSSASPANGSSPPANVLEHLIEFIQYAYGHYSQLFEDPSVAIFRAAWIEQLGDLARYRMAVAGLASRVSAAQQGHSHSNGGSLQLSHSPERQSRPAEAASIGVAALGDWDVEEQDSWRVIARDWYGQGVTETPGTGRLQHHLALLSKGDELRSLYHYVKSLTAAHPYLSARESILPLFEDEHQARRTQPDVTKAELFVHLHGMLFTKISLDDFDDVLARFMERLREESYLLERLDGDWQALGSGAAAPFGDAEWFMLAVINISALLQYGVEDGVLRKHTTKETPQHASHSRPATTSNGQAKTRTPQAIMLNPSSLKRETTADDAEDGESLAADSTSPDVVMKLNTSTEDDPLVFRLAQRLTFSMLEMALIHPCRTVGDAKIVNPYIILILTFLANMAQHSPALRHLERSVPWSAITAFFNSLPTGVEVRMDVPTKLLGSPLPEDWCIRGMDWTGKSLFGRGYWRTKTGGANSPSSRRDEMAPPPINGPSPATVESEMDALKFDLTILDEYGDSDAEENVASASAQLSTNRWRRVATLAAWLARSVPGLDYDNMATGASDSPRFIISGSLEAKLRRWRREDEEAKEAERASRASIWQREEHDEDESEEDVSDEEEEDDDNDNDSPAVKELKARRRHLKAVIRQARQTTRESPGSIRHLSSSKKQHKKLGNTRQFLKVFPGYTTLVFDTNILLTSMKLFRELIEAETWTIIVPLAVITELDGLKKNAAPLGIAASEAIEYLESAIRTHARHLKVQTSRGNYLRDLSIRSESIDFSASAEGLDQGFSHDFARTMDDVILRAVAWQQEHFTSRLAIVNPKADRKAIPTDAAQVVLVTFDRNLRLKARARGLDAADESGMAMMLEDSQENG